jgi:hypothetical protein
MLRNVGTIPLKRLVALVTLLAAASPVVATRVLIHPAQGGRACMGKIVIVPLCPDAVACDATPLEYPISFADGLLLPPGGRCRVRLESQTCWAPDVELGPEATDVIIATFPRAILSARVASDSPAVLDVRITSASETEPFEAVRACPVHGKAVQCEVPSAPINIRIGAAGRVPHYLWNVDLKPGATLEIGELRLSRGNSIAGRIQLPRNPKASPNVDLMPASLGRTLGQQGEAHYTTRVGKNGFFQFSDVADGHYDLIATLDGFSPARVRDVIAANASETFIRESLRFPPLSRLEAFIQPALTPGGRPWQYVLQRQVELTPFMTEVARGAADVSGSVRVDRLAVGPYRLRILDENGSVFRFESVDIAETEGPRFVRLEHVTVRGKVNDHEESIAAELMFRATDGTAASATSGDDGTYQAVLPHGGKWRVQVKPRRHAQLVRLPDVEIKPDESGTASLDLELPPGRISGKVVDESGKALALNVDVTRDGRVESQTISNDDGSFQLIGLTPGSVFLEAAGSDLRSGLVPYVVSESSFALDVTLVAFRQRVVTGFIITRDGAPIPGALLRCAAANMFEVKETVTGPSGDFSFKVPRAVTQVDAVILARGAPVTMKSLSVLEPANQNVMITLPDIGGTLKIVLTHAPPWPALRHEGGFVGLQHLLYPRGTEPPNHGIFPGGFAGVLEPGNYTVCPSAAQSPRCVTVSVRPGEASIADARQMWASEDDRKRSVP